MIQAYMSINTGFQYHINVREQEYYLVRVGISGRTKKEVLKKAVSFLVRIRYVPIESMVMNDMFERDFNNTITRMIGDLRLLQDTGNIIPTKFGDMVECRFFFIENDINL